MQYFKKKIALIEKQNLFLNQNNVFLWDEQRASKVLSDFKDSYKKILYQICPIPLNSQKIPDILGQDDNYKRDIQVELIPAQGLERTFKSQQFGEVLSARD